MSLINLGGGLSAAGSAISSFAGTAGLAQQKVDLEKQTALFADQLATTRESAGRVQAGQIAATAAEKEHEFQTGEETQREEAAKALQGTQIASTEKTSAASLAEQIRAHLAEEGNANLVLTTDPSSGLPAILDKKNNTITPVKGGASMPWNGNPAPTPPSNATAAPSSGSQNSGDKTGSISAPSGPSSSDAPKQATQNQPPSSAPTGMSTSSFIKALPQDAQDRFSQLPPMQRPIIAGLLSGATPPPPASGRSPEIMAILQNQIRMASYVDPNFSESVWTSRNKAATDMASSSPETFGGQRVAAQTLLGHLTGLANAAADNNSTSSLGWVGNAAGNTYVSGTSPGTPGNSAAKKAALEDFRVHQIGVGEEGTKIMSGAAGAQPAKEEMANRFSSNADITSNLGAIGGVAAMMKQRVQSQVDKWNQINGTQTTVKDWLGPEAYAQFQALTGLAADVKAGKNVTPQVIKDALAGVQTTGASATWEAAPPPVLHTPPPGSKILPDGRLQTPDGHIYKQGP